jgi:hypothetical protein
MGMVKLLSLQLYENMTFQETMVENEINEEMFIIHGYPLLPRFKTEPIPKFKKKRLQMVEKCVFKPPLQKHVLWG